MQRQGRSSLGLNAQREACARFAEAEDYTVVGEFVEIETGKGADTLDAGRSCALSSIRRSDGAAPS